MTEMLICVGSVTVGLAGLKKNEKKRKQNTVKNKFKKVTVQLVSTLWLVPIFQGDCQPNKGWRAVVVDSAVPLYLKMS